MVIIMLVEIFNDADKLFKRTAHGSDAFFNH